MRPKNEDCRDQITLGGGVFVRRAHLQKAQNAAANVIASTLVTKQGAFKAALLAEPAALSFAAAGGARRRGGWGVCVGYAGAGGPRHGGRVFVRSVV